MATGRNRDAEAPEQDAAQEDARESAPSKRSGRAARRSGNPARSGKFPEAKGGSTAAGAGEAAASADSGPLTIGEEIEEERLRQIAAEMSAAGSEGTRHTPTWYVAVMLGLMILGLLWICTFYLTQGLFPIVGLGSWNILIGFGMALVGFLMMSRWTE